MFAYMKERENKAGQQNICNVSSSTRDPFVGECVVTLKDLTPTNKNFSTNHECRIDIAWRFLYHLHI